MTLGAAVGVGMATQMFGAGLQALGNRERERAQSGAANKLAAANQRFMDTRRQVSEGAASSFRQLGQAFGDSLQANFESKLSEARVQQSQQAFTDSENRINEAVQQALATANVEGGAAGGELNTAQQKSNEGTREQQQPILQALQGVANEQAERSERGIFDLEQAGVLNQALSGLNSQATQIGNQSAIQLGQAGFDQSAAQTQFNDDMRRASEQGSGLMLGGSLLGLGGQFAQSAITNAALKKEAAKGNG